MGAKLSERKGYGNQNQLEAMEINNTNKKKSISNNNIPAFTSFTVENRHAELNFKPQFWSKNVRIYFLP